MFQVLVRNHPGNFGNCEGDRIYQYVYDCGINFYSRGKLLNVKEELKLEIDMSKLRQSTVDFLSRNLEKITAVILATDEIDLKSTSAVSEELEKRDRSVVQFLEILSNQLIYNNRTYFIYAQKMFAKANNAIQVEGDPRIIKSGMSKNVRFVGDNPSNSLPLVQVDPKKTLFFPGMALLEYIRLLTRTNLPDLDRRITDERFKRQLLKEIKGLAVRTSHLQKNSYFNIHGLTAEGPANIFFETKDGRKSVLQHFQDRYHFRVQFPNLPCVVERKVKKVDGQNRTVDSHYPMEVLVLEEGQRVPLSKMTPKLTEQMIRNCQARPSQFPRDLEQQRANAMIQSGAPNFRAFDIRIDTEIRKANAEIMFPPAIGYSNGVQQLPVQDRDGKDDVAWMVKGKRFLVPADDPKIWVAVLFQQGIPANDVKAFLQGLVRCAGDMGMNLNKENHQEGINSTDIETVRTRMMFFKNNGAKFVLFFTKDKLDPVHHTMKLLEVETGVVTQQVSKQTVDKVASGRGALLVYNNILQKLNMKLGGINWDLSTTQAFLTRNKTQQDVVKTMWLKQARMFIGIDMSHAGPQSFVERNQGVPPSDPTIVGMAFTAGHPLLIRGTYWCQTPRLTIVERLADKVTEALNIYKNIPQNKGNFPRQLVVFRGGVSEGDYAKVITQEERFFKMAFDNIKKEVPDFIEPILVIIVVQRTSNYRIVPQNVDPNANPARQNVPAGTVVDRGVMHPTQTEFLLVAHKAIQ
uniref:Uncharacterized protein n=1 Tax=Acrobeloides nanus TaxID=290746 RepID=A0A914CJI1_9BILA